MLAEAARTFAGYDRNGDGRLTSDEYSGRASVRSAMGGFVKEHSSEFDRDRDGIITRDEVNAFALRMFTKADQDANGTVTTEEANTRGGGGKNKKRPR
jgi:Ca2+-binding EF-hand superfamily protein